MKLDFENVVVGGSFDAVWLAFREGYPLIFKDIEKPYDEETIDGKNKKELMEQMLLLLGLSNLNLFCGGVDNIRIENQKIFVSGLKPWIVEICAQNIHNFTNESENFTVIDWIDVRSCGKHELREINSDSNFVKKIIFYPSSRLSRTKLFNVETRLKLKASKLEYIDVHKDIKVVSILSKKELDMEDFSPVYSRIKAKQLMKENGIIGKKRGFEKRPGFKNGQMYESIKLEFSKREIFPINVKEDKEFQFESKDPYIRKLIKYVYRSNRKARKPSKEK